MGDSELLQNLDHCICANLRRASRVITQAYDDAFRSLGLRATQIIILINANKSPSVTVNALSSQLSMDRTTLTRNLKPLEKSSFIQVGMGKDRRAKAITLTPKGKAVLAKAFPLWKKTQSIFVGSLGENGCRNLFKQIDHLTRAFDDRR
jgi:DNA-binding MarR family transcriptional regulator